MGVLDDIPKPADVRAKLMQHAREGKVLRRLLKLALDAHGSDNADEKQEDCDE